MPEPRPYAGKPHAEQTKDLWERAGVGIHIRFRIREFGEYLAATVLVGETTCGAHRNVGQLILSRGELAEIHKTFKGGCGLYGWRSDCEIMED